MSFRVEVNYSGLLADELTDFYDGVLRRDVDADSKLYTLIGENDSILAEYSLGRIIRTVWDEESNTKKEVNPEKFLTELEGQDKVDTTKEEKPRIPNYSYGFGDLLGALYNTARKDVPAVTNYQTDKKEN